MSDTKQDCIQHTVSSQEVGLLVLSLFSSYLDFSFQKFFINSGHVLPVHLAFLRQREKTEKEEFKDPYLAIGEQRWLFQDLMNLCLSDQKYLQGSFWAQAESFTSVCLSIKWEDGNMHALASSMEDAMLGKLKDNLIPMYSQGAKDPDFCWIPGHLWEVSCVRIRSYSLHFLLCQKQKQNLH